MSALSRAPDLLFEEEQRARLEEIGPLLEDPARLDGSLPLHRLTVFLTYRCNLSCRYCKTIARGDDSPRKRFTYEPGSFSRLLDACGESPLRHLHFTGGEAALVPALARMVRLAKERGIKAISLTSNGTLPAGRYLELASAGLDELRLSLDANEPALGQRLTSRRWAFAAAVRTLEELGAARRAGAAFTLIINTVVGAENRQRLPELVRFLLGFSPDDVKLITEVQLRGRLGDFPEARRVCAEVEELLEGVPPRAFPLLRRKLATVFAPDAIGLERERPPNARPWRCFVALTERTVDRAHYYPCSVYVREGGAPLGRLSDPPAVQRARLVRFAREADCLNDPICRRYCLHCTRAFNARANEEAR